LGDACNMELVQSIHDRLRDQIEQHKESHDPEPLELSVSDAAEILRDNGVEEENFFLIQWYPDEASAKAKLAQLEELGDGKQYLVDLTLKRENPSEAENFGNSNPVQLRS
jgi:hypothetical protein